jgi:LPS sulfotransferase NodH
MAHENFPLGIASWKWVYITREDLLAQAISLVLAEGTQEWTSRTQQRHLFAGVSKRKEADFDPRLIKDRINVIVDDYARWELFFAANGICPLRITYEQINDNIFDVMSKIMKHSGISNAKLWPGTVFIKKQRDELNDDWKARMLNHLP